MKIAPGSDAARAERQRIARLIDQEAEFAYIGHDLEEILERNMEQHSVGDEFSVDYRALLRELTEYVYTRTGHVIEETP